ncbi:hypothetical protein H5410_048426 [Solanum commersonii]|uniref:Jacalin-type lectin domain-containing protein n=1 Tax=Solanum commersonii TaxID=4109 RepID=A0A9J5XLS1_SOLCO|nr:hypothetical protein H5410_048426 [Solanum commersonii]
MDKITVVPEKALHGTDWDVKGLGQIAGIYVHYETDKVFALQLVFYEKNNLVKSKRHGQTTIGTANFSALVFDYPSEFLTEISGSHEIIIIDQPIFIRADVAITSSILTSIKFGTNSVLMDHLGIKFERAETEEQKSKTLLKFIIICQTLLKF